MLSRSLLLSLSAEMQQVIKNNLMLHFFSKAVHFQYAGCAFAHCQVKYDEAQKLHLPPSHLFKGENDFKQLHTLRNHCPNSRPFEFSRIFAPSVKIIHKPIRGAFKRHEKVKANAQAYMTLPTNLTLSKDL